MLSVTGSVHTLTSTLRARKCACLTYPMPTDSASFPTISLKHPSTTRWPPSSPEWDPLPSSILPRSPLPALNSSRCTMKPLPPPPPPPESRKKRSVLAYYYPIAAALPAYAKTTVKTAYFEKDEAAMPPAATTKIDLKEKEHEVLTPLAYHAPLTV